ncbi:MAG: recombinase family protein [Verrucomicrobiales bacterium]|nr:recombinase family protein [Verrucomicrobiales bacterium]
MSDKITSQHLERTAYVYIRQSTLQQVRNNLESSRRQYALEDRARALGFKSVVVIDDDLGISGTGSRERPGFARLLAAVCNGEVGGVFALEASRLARNNRDWHHLIDLCVLTETIVVDAEGIYDPRLLNDRMLLGLKGTMSEFEIGILRQRAREAYNQKIQRGEVMCRVAVGYVRSGATGIEMTPDREVQEAVRGLFLRFAQMGTLRQVFLWYHQQQILMPRLHVRDGVYALIWTLPDYQYLLRILKSPTYAGAFAHGRTKSQSRVVDGRSRKSGGHRVPLEQWEILIKDHHPAYITWERYLENLNALNSNRTKSHAARSGAPREGSALLAGLLRCRKCGHKMRVGYRGGGTEPSGRYYCMTGNRGQGVPSCQCFAAFKMDRAVVDLVLQTCQPLGIEASLQAMNGNRTEEDQKRRMLELAVERARYEVDRARRQYDAVDPANRLVAAELEARWNAALTQASGVEARLQAESSSVKSLDEDQRRRLMSLGADLQKLWNDEAAPMELKKRILRTVINEIVVDVNHTSGFVDMQIHWVGGVHTILHVRKNKSGHNKQAADDNTVELVADLAKGWPDHYIAGILNRIGCQTGPGNSWSENRVKSFRGQHKIPVFAAGSERPWLTMQEAAKELNVSVAVVRTMVKHGKLAARQIVKGVPWMIHREDLNTPAVLSCAKDARNRRKNPRENDQQILMPSI